MLVRRTAHLELAQRRLAALETSNQQLKEVADGLASRRDQLNEAIVHIRTEAQEVERAAVSQMSGAGGASGGLLGELNVLVAQRKDRERMIEALNNHRQGAASGIPVSTVSGGALELLASDASQSGAPVVVVNGHKELLLQQADEDRRQHAVAKQRAGQRINELVYGIDLCKAKDREAGRQLKDLEESATQVRMTLCFALSFRPDAHECDVYVREFDVVVVVPTLVVAKSAGVGSLRNNCSDSRCDRQEGGALGKIARVGRRGSSISATKTCLFVRPFVFIINTDRIAAAAPDARCHR